MAAECAAVDVCICRRRHFSFFGNAHLVNVVINRAEREREKIITTVRMRPDESHLAALGQPFFSRLFFTLFIFINLFFFYPGRMMGADYCDYTMWPSYIHACVCVKLSCGAKPGYRSSKYERSQRPLVGRFYDPVVLLFTTRIYYR